MLEHTVQKGKQHLADNCTTKSHKYMPSESANLSEPEEGTRRQIATCDRVGYAFPLPVNLMKLYSVDQLATSELIFNNWKILFY